MIAYFAYASNMSAPVMDAACPGHRFLGPARLPSHRLAFTRRSVRTGTGVADIVDDPASAVWGVLYELAEGELGALDRKEGAGWAYERREVHVHLDDARAARSAVAYVVMQKSALEIPPSDDYARRLVDAGRERGLPADYLAALGGHLDRVRRGSGG